MSITIVLASEINLDCNKMEGYLFLNKKRLTSEERKGYVLFTNHPNRKLEYQEMIFTIPVVSYTPELFREWLWKMHNQPFISGFRELQKIEDDKLRHEAEVYASIRRLANSFAKCESPVIVINNESTRPIAEVLVRYINYLNSGS